MKLQETKTIDLFDLNQSIAKPLLAQYKFPWQALGSIASFIKEIGPQLNQEEFIERGENIWIHKSVNIPATVSMTGPLIICKDAEIRHCAFFRGNVIIGEGAVAGNSCEFKNAIVFNKAQIPHYNYIGDSIIGYKSHLGASALTSNVKSDKKNIILHFEDGEVETGLRKFGAMVGDEVEVGCGSILNPGTIIGRGSNIYPLSSVRIPVGASSIYKNQNEIVVKIEE